MPTAALAPTRYRIAMSLLACVLMGFVGCANQPTTRESPLPLSTPFSASGDEVIPDRWWTTFEDPALDYYVNQALGGNFDLAAALHRLCAARALARREASDLLPDIDGIVGTDSTFGHGPDRTRIAWGLDASYQVDLWGQIESRVDAERFRADATHADYHAVALSLAAEVARSWYSLIEARAQLELLDEQVETNRKGLISQETRFAVGAGGGPDVLRQRQLVESTLEQKVVVQARIEVLEHQLALLIGQLPQEASYDSGSELPELPPLPAAGLPSELVARRPDVRREYLVYLAAEYDRVSAISAQYPRLNLTGSILNIGEPENLFRNWFVSIGSQLIAPLFDGGQRKAEVDRTTAVACQRHNEYEQTMLIAFGEVEDNLALERYQVQRIERLDAQVQLAEKAATQLRERLSTDDATFLDFLSASQAEQRLQREILAARLDLILIRIGLYLALAGDFDTQPYQLFDSPVVPAEESPVEEDPADLAPTAPPDSPLDQTALPKGTERLPPVEPPAEINTNE